jgi:uroporphyrinogen decarboxylase
MVHLFNGTDSVRGLAKGLPPVLTVQALSKKERYLLAARGAETDFPPAWIMRQAGRYDPKYMALRERYSFRDLCLDPDACAAASIIPLTNLDVDALIIFNDILIPLEAMGLQVDFPDTGPSIANPPRIDADLNRFKAASFDNPPVAANIRALRKLCGPDVPIFGFAGCPFTLVSYAVEGRMSRNQHHIKGLMYSQPELLEEMLSRVTDTAAAYLVAQVEQGGADAVQIFESQASAVAPAEYERFAAKWQRRLISRFKAACPDTPLTLYARGTAPILQSMVDSGADVVSIDWNHTLADARAIAGGKALQGNLDPGALLVAEAVPAAVQRMVEGFDWRQGYIANLGHGIFPQCTVEGAQAFVTAVHSLPSLVEA